MSDTKSAPVATHQETEHLTKELKKHGWEQTAGGWYNGKLTRELGVVTFDAALLLQLRGSADPRKVSPRTCDDIDGA